MWHDGCMGYSWLAHYIPNAIQSTQHWTHTFGVFINGHLCWLLHHTQSCTIVTADCVFDEGKFKSINLDYVFCPAPHCKQLLWLFTKHFCQHPLFPECGVGIQSAEEIHRNAVAEMYQFCYQWGLWEVWGYMWIRGTCWGFGRYGPDPHPNSSHTLGLPWASRTSGSSSSMTSFIIPSTTAWPLHLDLNQQCYTKLCCSSWGPPRHALIGPFK
jgi:hypothetical protein